jgi:murein DD-endopeptidase MepM/ murein hydrolase activator NlpD
LRDLISQNDLTPPYFLKAGDRLVLPGAAYHKVVSGDTLYDISRSYGMNLSALIKINDFKKPYRLKVGDEVRINNNSGRKLVAKKTTNNAVSKRQYSKARSVKSGELSSPAKIVNKNNKFIKPVSGKVISKFGYKAGGLSNGGINIKSPKGASVKAIADGVVAYAGLDHRGYGNLVIVKHSKGWISAYGHLGKSNIKRGDKVSRGQVIAYVGSTGNVKFPQLYFGLRKGREAVNPQSYL